MKIKCAFDIGIGVKIVDKGPWDWKIKKTRDGCVLSDYDNENIVYIFDVSTQASTINVALVYLTWDSEIETAIQTFPSKNHRPYSKKQKRRLKIGSMTGLLNIISKRNNNMNTCKKQQMAQKKLYKKLYEEQLADGLICPEKPLLKWAMARFESCGVALKTDYNYDSILNDGTIIKFHRSKKNDPNDVALYQEKDGSIYAEMCGDERVEIKTHKNVDKFLQSFPRRVMAEDYLLGKKRPIFLIDSGTTEVPFIAQNSETDEWFGHSASLGEDGVWEMDDNLSQAHEISSSNRMVLMIKGTYHIK